MRHHSIPFVVLHVCDTIRTTFKPIRNNASRMFAISKTTLKRFIVGCFRLDNMFGTTVANRGDRGLLLRHF